MEKSTKPVVEYRSSIEDIKPAKELIFGYDAGFGSYRRYLEHAIQHPAKMSTSLLEYLIKNYTEESSTILDPFAGSFSTNVVASLNNRNSIGIELESKFVQFGIEAKKKVEEGESLIPKGSMTVLRGDSRDLLKILSENVDSIITSPPYSDTPISAQGAGSDQSLNDSYREYKKTGDWTNLQKVLSEQNKNSSYDKALVDAVITSPPYSDIFGSGHKSKLGEKTQGGSYETYEEKISSENIGNLKHGDIDTVITSPPYENQSLAGGDKEQREKRLEEAGYNSKDYLGGRARNTGLTNYVDSVITSPPYADTFNKKKHTLSGIARRDPKMRKEVGGYTGIDSVITSPPYADTISRQGGDPTVKTMSETARSMREYSQNEENLGNLKQQSYLEAVYQVYRNCYEALKPGGLCIVVVKPFQRKGEIVDLPKETLQLLINIGFRLEEILKMRLHSLSFWRILQYKRNPKVAQLWHEYILILRKPLIEQ